MPWLFGDQTVVTLDVRQSPKEQRGPDNPKHPLQSNHPAFIDHMFSQEPFFEINTYALEYAAQKIDNRAKNQRWVIVQREFFVMINAEPKRLKYKPVTQQRQDLG
jgi:hypothetical protein